MSIVSAALKKPIATIVVFAGILIFSIFSIITIPIDIFPKLNLPTIYVIESYAGMSPQQMEGFFSTRLQDQLLYVQGVKTISSKNIQGLAILKLTFYENVNMAEASSQLSTQLNRAQNFFPPGATPPQVIRFDASSLPVGQLTFFSSTRNLKEVNDLAITRVRPLFATVPGLSAAPPFGGNARSILINADPDKLRSFSVTPDQVVEALARNNAITPSGNIRINNTMLMTTINSLEQKADDFGNIPITSVGSNTIFVRDVANVSDGADVTVGYALVNGKRSVYIPVVKSGDASTWSVVQALKAKLPEMQNLLPEDVKISYEFDQSVFVINAVKSLIIEGVLGAVLTGLMVLLFLGDFRSSIIVIITIPVSILSAVFFLSLSGQTINLMTLSGLALAIGVLVDQATVTIENIHQHLEMNKTKKQAIYDACEEISFPLLLILLCILAVFAPSFIMTGVPKALFLPLSLSIGFSMIISFFAAQSLVPVLANWLLKSEKFQQHHGNDGLALDDNEIKQISEKEAEEIKTPEKNNFFERFKLKYKNFIENAMRFKIMTTLLYAVIVIGAAGFCFVKIGKDLMPRVNAGQFQLRVKLGDGTRLERTENKVHDILDIIDSTVHGQVAISSAFVGLIPSSYLTSNLYIFNAGTNEAVIQINLEEGFKGNLEMLKDTLRSKIAERAPDVRLSFEPIDLTEKIMSQGASTPIEVRVAGKNMKEIETYAEALRIKLKEISYLRDIQIAQPTKYPVIRIEVDRFKAAQMGLDIRQIARSVTDATSSSRFTEKNLWLDEKAAYTYNAQVEIPEYALNDLNDLKEIPLLAGQSRPVLQEVANFRIDTIAGEIDRAGPRRYLTVSANIHQKDLASATTDVGKVIKNLGEPPKGLIPEIQGTSTLLTETFAGLQNGLSVAILVIFLLLAANYQSFAVSFAVLTTVPAVILGSLLALFITGSTLNLQSYMGMIMATGVSVANAILIVTNAEKLRVDYKDATRAAVVSASIRLRPILMTSLAMIAGMIPMASGMGEAGDQTAPLGRAVIGGLFFSTLAALLILPQVYAFIQRRAGFDSPTLMPEE